MTNLAKFIKEQRKELTSKSMSHNEKKAYIVRAYKAAGIMTASGQFKKHFIQ